SDARHLRKLLRGELDWVVMKCLEKDRNRRYETADALALDLARYLNDEPVQACPPSLSNRLRKFARRHRAAIGTALLLLAVMLTGTGLAIWQALRAATAQAAEVSTRLELSETRRRSAVEQSKEIARQLETLNKANSLLESARSHVAFNEWAKAET